MKLYLGLMWIKSKRNLKSSFKLVGAADLFATYLERLRPYCDAEAQSVSVEGLARRGPGEILWLCERVKGRSQVLSSEDLAKAVQKNQLNGAKRLWVVIGPPDGLSNEDIVSLRPDLLWSFGAATYPHELASVLAAEQLYRAWTILQGHPYHLGH
jgi:23S rRNA (pseudouridine1915-N3)-methyltransferase